MNGGTQYDKQGYKYSLLENKCAEMCCCSMNMKLFSLIEEKNSRYF